MARTEPASYSFNSDLFLIEDGEDKETNPRMYGRQLSNWLRQKLTQLGYDVEEVIPEDFGWLVLCQRSPYSLGVACVSHVDYENSNQDDPVPSPMAVTWCCTVFVEVPFFKNLFKRIHTADGEEKLERDLYAVLSSESRIGFVDPV
ncbi:MAG: hypothetical protein AAGH76_00145 [Pseudomonadota bacterium]